MCTSMFITALFITAKIRRQPQCPSVREWINKQNYHATVRKDEADRNWEAWKFL